MPKKRTRPVKYPTIQALGANIEAVRKYMGLTQAEFGEMIGVDKYTICSWECSRTAPSAKYIIMICYKCGVSADDLLGIPREWVKIK